MNEWLLPRKAVTSSGAELPAAMKVAPATSWERPRPATMISFHYYKMTIPMAPNPSPCSIVATPTLSQCSAVCLSHELCLIIWPVFYSNKLLFIFCLNRRLHVVVLCVMLLHCMSHACTDLYLNDFWLHFMLCFSVQHKIMALTLTDYN